MLTDACRVVWRTAGISTSCDPHLCITDNLNRHPVGCSHLGYLASVHRIFLSNVVIENREKVGHDGVTLECDIEPSIDVHWRSRLFSGTRKGYSNVSVFG